MFTAIEALVKVRSTVMSSVLNAQVMMGSPSSQTFTLNAWSRRKIISCVIQDIKAAGRTIQSSRMVDRDTARIVTNGIFRSQDVDSRPSFMVEITK
jgi:hypothetical protein